MVITGYVLLKAPKKPPSEGNQAALTGHVLSGTGKTTRNLIFFNSFK
jgi:hypothetical protein